MSQKGKIPHIVIIGGGFGGLQAAKALARKPVKVTLIDKKNHHTFQPLLYQVATAVLSPGEIASPIRRILYKYQNIEVLLGDGFDIPEGVGDFDRIIVTAAMEHVPEKLLARLEPGGRLIAPVGPHQGVQTLTRVTRTEAGFDRKSLVDVRFVPALPGIAREL